MKRKVKVLLVVTLVLAILAIGSIVYGFSPIFQLGKSFNETTADQSVLVKIGDTSITQYDLARFAVNQKLMVLAAENNGEKYTSPYQTDQQIMEKLIEDRILYLQAEQEGLVVSDDVLNETIGQAIQFFSAAKGDVVADAVREFADGLGMTTKEYIESCRSAYKEQLSIGLLRSYYTKGLENADAGEEKWEQVKLDIINRNQNQIVRIG